MRLLDLLKRAEWIVAILLSATALFLLSVRATHAGALWRDESAVVQLAQMPTLADIADNFQHEAFPVPFPLFIRAYTHTFGTSDAVLRAFGFGVGALVLCALWITAYLIGYRLPLVGLALLGLNATFLVWGTTIRGYGLGSALIVLTFGCIVSALTKQSTNRIVVSALMAIAAVQCLVHNLVLVFALTSSAAIVCSARRDFKRASIFLSVFAVSAISFVPYIDRYFSGSPWSQVVEFPVSFRLLWKQLNFALGNPIPALAWFWHVAFVILIAVTIWQIYRSRLEKPDPKSDILLFTALASVASLVGYYEFLQTLSYLTRSWYFLALLSILAVSCDCLAGTLTNLTWLRVGRLVFATIALVVLPITAWPKAIERQTNVDIIAERLRVLAKPDDLIVVAPWQYGVSFNRYYRGTSPWMTLPAIADLRVHRYDLFREKMLSTHPIADVLEKIERTLTTGNRVWFVGGIKLPAAGHQPVVLPPAPNTSFGWDNVAYSESWREQVGALVREHASRGEAVSVPAVGPVNYFENISLSVVEGWR